MPGKCILCGSHEISILEQLSTNDILRCNSAEVARAAAPVLARYQTLTFCHCRECDLRFFSPPVAGSKEYYNAIQALPWYYLEDKPEYQAAEKWISPEDRVLEVGCGSGAFSKHIGAERYTGLEFSEKAIQSATARGLHVENASIERHAFERPGDYDVVCAFQVLEHVATVHGFIAASVRALRRGGLLIYCVPSEESYVAMMHNAGLNLPPHHVTRWTDTALRNIARVFPLELVSIEHEVLAEFHKTEYASLLVLHAVGRMLGRKRKSALLDLSRSYRVLNSLAWRAGKIIQKGLDDRVLLPRGHSVTAVFRKSETPRYGGGVNAAQFGFPA